MSSQSATSVAHISKSSQLEKIIIYFGFALVFDSDITKEAVRNIERFADFKYQKRNKPTMFWFFWNKILNIQNKIYKINIMIFILKKTGWKLKQTTERKRTNRLTFFLVSPYFRRELITDLTDLRLPRPPTTMKTQEMMRNIDFYIIYINNQPR